MVGLGGGLVGQTSGGGGAGNALRGSQVLQEPDGVLVAERESQNYAVGKLFLLCQLTLKLRPEGMTG